MDFRILGPLEVRNDLGAIDVPGRKPRAVLAVLLLHANQSVSAERLAVALWGEDAPGGAIRTVHVNVSRLRKALGEGDVLTTTPAGYCLRVGSGELDADRFQALAADGRRALDRGQADAAGRLLREALALWRGPPLGDLAFESFAQADVARLEEQREAAIAARVDADLAAGRHAELVGELRRLVAEHPKHEGLAGQLMLALYRCGRQADALDEYREARRRLADELGVEPGDGLRRLHQSILEHDPELLVVVSGELPHELDAATAPPLAGRERELAWLHERWEEARSGAGRLIALAGAHGMGKTRLAAELATEVHASGGSVLYASGAGPASAVHDVLARGREAPRPLLLVIDEADQAPTEVLRAVRDAAGGAALVLATATVHEALDGLDPGAVLFLDLDRLGPAAVAEIAALYTPGRTTEDIPAEWLLGASAGVPKRVHDVASQWARERVGAVAGHAAAERSRLRSMEDELAGGVVHLQSVREWREPPEDGERVICPFKGLASFQAADAPYFFGRERLVAELVARLVGAPLLAVIGPSGSGKSSVVRAGLLPALASGVLPGSERWPQYVIRPGEHPLRRLDETLAQAPDERFVLAVDQFEEAFTACRDETERADFFSALVRESDAVVLIALRADFYGRCAEYPALARLLASNHVLVGPMQPEELRRAIVCPAQRVGLSVEDELAQRIVDDVEDAPGALPLLSTALLELWQHRDGRRLRLAAYERTGGVHGAVARLAEEAFNHLDEKQRARARRVLLKLVEVDDEGSAERRRLPLTALGADAEPLLDVLADARLVTVSEGCVELAHEALLREWPRLNGWIEDGLEDLRIERSLRAGAREWERVRHDDGALFRGARLAEASDWSERVGASEDLARDFLGASLERERRDRMYRRRRLTFAFAALALGLVAVAVFAAMAIEQRRDAERQRDVATSRQLGVQSASSLGGDPELALRLALTALDTTPTAQAATALREATAAFDQRGSMRADSTSAWTAAFSPDGSRVLTGGDDGNALLWDTENDREVERWAAGHESLNSARYSRTGDRIVLGFEDGTVAITDGSLGSPEELMPPGNGGSVRSVAFSGDGEHVAAASDDGTTLFLAADGSGRAQRLSGTPEPTRVDVNPDGSQVAIASYDGSVRLWSPATGDVDFLVRDGGWFGDVAFDPEGRWIVAVGEDGLVHRWDARTRRELRRTPGGGAELFSVAFSADGERFAAGSQDGTVRVWTTPGAPPVASLRGPAGWVYDVAFGATGDRLVSAEEGGMVRVWDAGATQAWKLPSGSLGLSFNHDGTLLATGSGAGTVRVWDASSGELVDTVGGGVGETRAQFSPTTDSLVLADDASPRVRVWSREDGTVTTAFSAPEADGLYAARFDSDGDRIVYAATNGRLAVRTLSSGEDVRLGGAPKAVYDAQFSADGTRVAVISDSGTSAVWRLDRPERPERLLRGHRGYENGLDYGADGRLVTAGSDRSVRVWPAGGTTSMALLGHARDATDAAFSLNGDKVVSASMDRTLRLWDSRTGVLLAVLETAPAEIHSMQLSSDGKIATVDEDLTLRVRRCEVCGSLQQVQALARSYAPRQLTRDERRQYLAPPG